MAKILHINCPKCGGALGMVGRDRVVKCRYCGTWSMVDFPEAVPEYWVKPMLKEVEARRIVQNLLRDKEMPEGLLKQARFHSARLYFIPFHELSARRLGTMTQTQFEQQKVYTQRTTFDAESGMQRPLTAREQRLYNPVEKKVDTKVVMADATRLEPAIQLHEWGLEESDINAIRSDKQGVLQPMNRGKLEAYGKIYDPAIEPEQILEMLKTRPGTQWLDDKTEFAEARVKRIYYPVWRVRYRYQGRLYGASVDGVTGKIMIARAPQDDRSRVLWFLGTTAIVSFIIGRLAHGALGSALFDPRHADVIIQVMARGFHILIPLVLVGLLLAVTIVGFGWEQFRYPGEIVIQGDKRKVIKLNRPDHTVFDTIQNLLSGVLGDSFKLQRRDYY